MIKQLHLQLPVRVNHRINLRSEGEFPRCLEIRIFLRSLLISWISSEIFPKLILSREALGSMTPLSSAVIYTHRIMRFVSTSSKSDANHQRNTFNQEAAFPFESFSACFLSAPIRTRALAEEKQSGRFTKVGVNFWSQCGFSFHSASQIKRDSEFSMTKCSWQR